MSAQIYCPKCGKRVKPPDYLPRGARVRCKTCRTVFAPIPLGKTVADAFETFGLTTDATLQQVKEAYRDLAQVWHPDRFRNSARLTARAEAKMKAINHAFQSLKTYFADNHQERSGESANPTSDPTGMCKEAEGDDDLRSDIAVKPSSHLRKRPPKAWWRSRKLRWALIMPGIILVPLFFYLALHWREVQYREKIAALEAEARQHLASGRIGEASAKYQELGKAQSDANQLWDQALEVTWQIVLGSVVVLCA